MPESNHSRRHIPCLMKSCFPTPAPHHPRPFAAISSLPDDLLVECLSRVPSSSLPLLSLVCRRWSHLLSSAAFSRRRRRLGLLRPTLFAFSVAHSLRLSAARLRLDPPRDGEARTWKLALLPVRGGADLGCLTHSRAAVAVGRQIYVLGHGVMLRYDPWTGKLVRKRPTAFPRKKFAAAAVAGKIYVAGGSARTGSVEEYDPEANEWRVVAHARRRRYGCLGASVDGVFYVIGGLKLGASAATVSGNALSYARSMDLYDTEAGAWLRSRSVPGGGCVVAACSAGGHVYVLASHAVDLSFWRFDARRKGCGGAFGEWRRIRGPPVPAQVRVAEGGVRFRCVGVGDNQVAVVHARPSTGEGSLMVYDGVTEEWGWAADLPGAGLRAACACVEC